MNLRKSYIELRENIRTICDRVDRSPYDIQIVAVSKTVASTKIAELHKLGQIDFGESRTRDLKKKCYDLSFQHTGKINWHLIGHLQSNKVEDIIAFVHLIHSVDNLKLAEAIDKSAGKINKTIDILIQVNTSNEPQKFGVTSEDAVKLCNQISLLHNIRVKGLMTIARLTEDKDEIRQSFRSLKNLFDEMKPGRKDFEYLSMGMTHDYDIAIEEGSNMIRIGSALFGEREGY